MNIRRSWEVLGLTLDFTIEEVCQAAAENKFCGPFPHFNLSSGLRGETGSAGPGGDGP